MATIDDVYNLLDQINKVTLRRMETENETTLARIEAQVKEILQRVKVIDTTALPNLSNNVGSVMQVISNTLHPNIVAIKNKVGALTAEEQTATKAKKQKPKTKAKSKLKSK